MPMFIAHVFAHDKTTPFAGEPDPLSKKYYATNRDLYTAFGFSSGFPDIRWMCLSAWFRRLIKVTILAKGSEFKPAPLTRNSGW